MCIAIIKINKLPHMEILNIYIFVWFSLSLAP